MGRSPVLFVAWAVLAVLCFTSLKADEIQKDEGVLVLRKTNFEQAIKDYKYVLVEFYAPWCGHCKALAPEYAKAAQDLVNHAELSEVALGKVDATEEQELAEEHKVRGYPTLKFFRNGSPIDYSGGRTAADIINWIKKKTGPAAKMLDTSDATKSFQESAEVAVVGFYSDHDSANAKVFLEVAAALDDYPFGIVKDSAIFSEHSASDGSIVLYKKFDDGKAVFDGSHSTEEIIKFVKTNALPLIVPFNQESAQKIFGGDIKNHVLLFIAGTNSEHTAHLENLKPIAKNHKDKILYVSVDTDDEENKRVLEFFGMAASDIPSFRVIRLDEDMAKYKPDESDLSASYVESYVNKYLEGKLKPHLLSQDVPEDWDKAPVKVLVGKNFDEVAFDKSKDVLVEFYAPWCGHCKQLAPIYDQLAESFKDDASIVIAKIDSTANELEHTKIQSFPTIKLFKKETNEVVDFSGERTLDGLSKFVKSGGELGRTVEPEAEDLDEEEDDKDEAPSRDEL